MRGFFLSGCIFAALGVAAGAFGAHALDGILTEQMLETFETACRYQMYHSFALIAISLAGKLFGAGNNSAFWLSGVFFLAGIILFSGSLFAYALSGQQWIAAVTPLGGLFLLAGWVSPVFHHWKG
jgi:uncharacterized membrane protein YgdD (TMEM256/DUF423 family)